MDDWMGSTRNVQQKLNRIMEELEKVAKTFGHRSKDVELLLDAIKVEVERYKGAVDEVLDKDEISRDDYTRMKAMELDLLRAAIRMSEFDQVISDEEAAILKHLEEFIKSIEQKSSAGN